MQIALTNFYGISYDTANRLCARLSLHDRATVASLTEAQITQLSAYLSSPAPSTSSAHPTSHEQEAVQGLRWVSAANDTLRQIKIEADLKRVLHANINTPRNVGTYGEEDMRHICPSGVRGQVRMPTRPKS